MLGPALVAAFPSLTRLSLDFSYGRGHAHAPGLKPPVGLTTLTTLRAGGINGEYFVCDPQRAFEAISALGSVVRALTLYDTCVAEVAGFQALESLAVTNSRAAGLELWLRNEWSAGITDVGLGSISEHMPQLRRLHVQNCRSITDAGIRRLAHGCPLLEGFGVRDCPNPSVRCAREILSTCLEVRRLHCQQSWSCHWLHPSKTASMSRLEVLELHVPREAGVNFTAMATLASSCVRLRGLHVHTPHSDVSMPDPLEDCPPMLALVWRR
eukprot:SM000033S12383  [mRNA]  locus=s33:515391:516397:- [translate_table: standard]